MLANTIEIQKLKSKISEIIEYEEETLRFIEERIATRKLDLDELERIRDFVGDRDFLRNFISFIDIKELLQNSYLKDIDIQYVRNDKLFLSNWRTVRKNSIVRLNTCLRDDNFMPIREWGYFDRNVSLPVICENDTNISWMTVEPYEINTFSSFAESAKGRILLGGCGLGYIAYMLSLKDDVYKITIVEKDKDVIELFKSSILPQFKNKDKIKIVEGDIIEYLKVVDLSHYDEVNIDVWRDYIDMIYIYLEALVVEHNNPQVKFSYWLEENLRYKVGKSILKAFIEKNDPNDIFDIVGKYILDNVEIKGAEDLRNLIKLDNMREILYTWYVDNVELTDMMKDKMSKILDSFMKISKQIL